MIKVDKMAKFKCGVCGYIYDGAEAPDKCPKCGAPKEKFIKLHKDLIKNGFECMQSRTSNRNNEQC